MSSAALNMLRKVAAAGSKRQRGSDDAAPSSSGCSDRPPFHHVEHYDDRRFSFPTRIDSDFPRLRYKSRQGDVKTAVHWGQRKLLLSEIQLLSQYCRRGVRYLIVYAGSAPGTHLAFLDSLFDDVCHEWELIDPGRFDVAALGHLPNFRLRNEFFTNETAYEIGARRIRTKCAGLAELYRIITLDIPKQEAVKQEAADAAAAAAQNSGAQRSARDLQKALAGDVGHVDVARGTHDIPSMYEPPVVVPYGLGALFSVAMEARPMLFISDIRSGSLAHDNFEHHVMENMRAQECWTTILEPDHALLKFRLPYTYKLPPGAVVGGCSNEDSTAAATAASGPAAVAVSAAQAGLVAPDGTVQYLRGDVIIPIWTRPTSTEARLCVPRGAFRRSYDIAEYEDQCFFLNAKLRETFHFNHLLAPHEDLDNHYDSAAEVHALTQLVLFQQPGLNDWQQNDASRVVLTAKVRALVERITGEIGCTFSGAIRRRERIILEQAALGWTVADFYRDDGVLAEGTDAPPAQRQRQSWEPEARRLIEAASRERLRPLWSRNFLPPDDSPSGTQWRCVEMPQH